MASCGELRQLHYTRSDTANTIFLKKHQTTKIISIMCIVIL